MDFAMKLWNEKRWLFWLLIPVILLWVLKDAIFSLLTSSVKTTVDKAQAKDEVLQQKTQEAEKASVKEEAKVEVIEQRIQTRDESDVSLDWQKTWKKKD